MANQRDIHDHWFNQAKRDGYRSRAAYKLMQIDDRRSVLRKGDAVLDLGCMPGSWLQVAAERVGSRGEVWGIDLKETTLHGLPATVHVLCGDAAHLIEAGLPPERRFNAIVSDMMPNTTGSRETDHFRSVDVCELAMWLAPRWLKPGGNVVMKLLEGSQMPRLLKDAKAIFTKVKPFKPEASRSDSTEIYIVALGFNGDAIDPRTDPAPTAGPPETPEGW